MSSSFVKDSFVKKRCVFHVIGYEALAPGRIHRRFERELDRFRSTWNVTTTLSPAMAADDGAVSWRIDSAGPNWRVETDVTLLDWSDIVVADFAQSRWRLIPRGVLSLFDFMLSGATAGYLRTNWRYLMFYIYPLLLLGLFGVAGFVVAQFAITNGLPWPFVLGPVLGVACFLLLIQWLGRSLYLDYMLLGWSFSSDVVYRRRPEFEAVLDRLAEAFSKRLRASAADEVIIVSYSFGAVIMMQIVARALQMDSGPARSVDRINLVSAGSSLLKVGLHPAADAFRAAVRHVVDEPAIYWVEYQAIVDILNFYKTDPVAEMGLPACGKPIVRIVRIRDLITEASYRRVRWNLFSLHLQYVMGNERRHFYDFFLICCGPVRLQCHVDRPDEEGIGAFAPDGTYRSMASAGLANDAVPQ